MNRNGQVTLAALFILFIGVIFVLAIFPAIADQQTVMTTKQLTANETVALTKSDALSSINDTALYTLANANTDQWKIDDCPLTNVVLSNQSGSVLTVTTDYIFNTTYGTFQMVNSTTSRDKLLIGSGGINNNTYVSYEWCRDGYINEGAGRSLAGLLMLFVALGVLGFTVYYALRGYFK